MPSDARTIGSGPTLQLPNSRNQRWGSDDHIVDIPLTNINSNQSRKSEKASRASSPYSGKFKSSNEFLNPSEMNTIEQRLYGRRRLKGPDNESGEGKLTKVGQFWETILNSSIIIRYIVYIVPVSLILAIVTLIGAFGPGKDTKIGGVRMVWLFIWIHVVWVSLWVSKLFCKSLPYLFQVVVGVISSGVRKYYVVIQNLELPLSLVFWAVCCLTTFSPIMTRNPDKRRTGDTGLAPWMIRMNAILGSFLVSAVLYLAEKTLVQVASVNYHRRQFEQRVNENKRNIKLLSYLYEASRDLFPDYTEFTEEDYTIHQGIAGLILKTESGAGTGNATPMRQFVGNLNVAGNKFTSVVGNVAREVTGKNLFNPNSAYSIVMHALEHKNSSKALARRIWMSFVTEDSDVLTKEDLMEVLGSDKISLALESFSMLDKDENGDISLEEMIMGVNFMLSEQRDIAKGVKDVSNALGVLDNLLVSIVMILIIFVFMAFNFSSFSTTLAAAGTVLLSLSFIFALTSQEILAACIFVFIKHPFDVGDRVDINDSKLVVLQIALLYTVFSRTDTGKIMQIPNNILNTLWIENISRSRDMTEPIKVFIDYGTSFEDIQKLKDEMAVFLKDNPRDYLPDVDIVISSINNLDKIELTINILHKGNWSNLALATQRRNKFICALIMAIKTVPIYGPGGGDPGLGEVGKPMYTVAIADEIARENMRKASEEKAKLRWDHEESHFSDNESIHTEKGKSTLPPAAEVIQQEYDPVKGKVKLGPPTDTRKTDMAFTSGSDALSAQSGLLDRTRSIRSTVSKAHSITDFQKVSTQPSTRGRRKAFSSCAHYGWGAAHDYSTSNESGSASNEPGSAIPAVCKYPAAGSANAVPAICDGTKFPSATSPCGQQQPIG
ncbi:Mechanosensitive ion channel-domain-containing protein [Peziza echinospora]|nr:Mechanosensitive ion channel-domain-containing protein [Peziza echinospora]